MILKVAIRYNPKLKVHNELNFVCTY
jgi:hypothetical protein